MKRTLYNKTLSALLLTLVGALGFVSCTDNDGVGTPNGGPVPVSIHVSADLLGDLNATRASNGDEYATNGEFMHTLCVFVVNSETRMIEAKFCTLEDGVSNILTEYSDATDGDLTDWTSEEFVLSTGEKTIYAFSNWNYMDSKEWAALIAKEEGDKIEDKDLQFAVDDPASKVDIANGKYIPMSGKATVVVYDLDADLNRNAQLFSVGMDRLVGKVMVTVQGETNTNAEEVTVTGISFSGCADKVPMMSDDNSTYTYTCDIGCEATYADGIKVAANGSATLSLYVNETYRSKATYADGGFTISLDTDKYGGLTYSATTVNEDIPRNYIYPLVLTLDSYELVLTPTAWTSILGVDAELEYDSPITVDGDTYYISMLDVTSTFSITPSLVKVSGSTAVEATWTWTYVDEDGTETEIEKTTIPACTVDAKGVLTATILTATPGYVYAFTLGAEWTESSSSNSIAHSRLYNVKVIFEDAFPTFKQASRAWWTRPYGSELLHLKVR